MIKRHVDLAFHRAVEWISREFGRLDDVPGSVIPVIWVTVYRSMEAGLEAEKKGGAVGIAKDALLLGDMMQRLDTLEVSLQFLQTMIPIIRASGSKQDQLADSQLLIDMLKWGMVDAPNMSGLKRLIARRFAKADPMYEQPVPSVIVSGSA
jgi:hypothetical protein